MKLTCLVFLFLFFVLQGFSQNYPPPSGIFCSCGPTIGVGNGSVDPTIATKPFVKGILVRVPWNLLEPTNNTYNWSLIDGQLSAAKNYGKKIALGIGNGPDAPAWLYDKGVPKIIATVPRNDTIAVAWDSTFLAEWAEFVAALGNRYKTDTTIQLVYITNSTSNGFEMQLPFQSTPTLPDAGYTDSKMIGSWKKCMDAFNTAFPNHYLTNDFHPVNGSDAVADSVYNYADATIGKRYGASAWWWTQKNTGVYAAQYALTKHSAKNNAFTGVQFAYNGTADSAKFGTGGMQGALQLAIDDGICYWELWNQDILNPKFEALLTTAKCAANTTTVPHNAHQQGVSIYPNPAQNELVVYAEGLDINSIAIFSLAGQKLLQETVLNSAHTINTLHLPDGLYIVEVNMGNYTKRIKCRIAR